MRELSVENTFDASALRRRIDRIGRKGQLAFMLSCAERLAANYDAFSRHHGWGDPTVLQQALDLGWRCLAGEEIESSDIISCLKRCDAVTPNTEEFDSEYVSSGLDAAVCCMLVLEFLLDNDCQKVVEAASLARDTVDMYVQGAEDIHPHDPDLESRILQHPLMQRELKRQREDLDLIESSDLSGDTVEMMGHRWRHPTTSNIDRSRIET